LCRKNIAYETIHDGSATEAVERLANFGKRHRLSLRGFKIKDLINRRTPVSRLSSLPRLS